MNGLLPGETLHHAAMRRGSDALRDRILNLLAERNGKFAGATKRHSAARRAIARGFARDQVMALFDLSASAYDDLAGQVRKGLVE